MNEYKRSRILWTVLPCLGLMLIFSACGSETQTEDANVSQAESTRVSTVQEQESEAKVGEGSENGDAVSYDNLPVVYSVDNSDRTMESKSGTFTGDWDGDEAEDTLTIRTAEQEGSEMIEKLELALSGCTESYVIENADCDFIDIQTGDFDGDEEPEILLLFDMRYAGANGCCGLQLLDKTDSGYENVGEDFFTGFTYSMEVQEGEAGGYRVVSDQSKAEFLVEEENARESAIAEVTGWYALEILEGETQDYIRLKQYIAGEDMTDHVGDMVTVLSLENGEMKLAYEYYSP